MDLMHTQPNISQEALRRSHCTFTNSGIPRNFFWGGGFNAGIFSGVVQQIQLRKEVRENGDLGVVIPLVGGSGGSYNLVQEISFHIVKFS
jgi:hypothetical protein